MELENRHCVPCSGKLPPLSLEDAQAKLSQVREWTLRTFDDEPHLVRTYTFDRYADGLNFTLKVGEMADAENHHPSIITSWGKVTVHWWTHAIKGLHDNDFIMAAKTDGIYRELTGS